MSDRLDVFLVKKSYVKSRVKAKELVLSGNVSVNGEVIIKPSVCVNEDCEIIISDSESHQYVGRGALKLKGAFECFDICVKNRYCADIGASTGGFTQVLLENGAKKVYAVDVGHGQLAKELADDKRVKNCEGVNVREVVPEFFSEPIEFMCGDLSFISLKLVIPPLKECLAENGEMIMLIKPQFEAGRKALNKKGIVKDKKDHIRVMHELFEFFESCGLELLGIAPSPIKGGDGNIEYLAHLKKTDLPFQNIGKINIKEFVDSVFLKFSKAEL